MRDIAYVAIAITFALAPRHAAAQRINNPYGYSFVLPAGWKLVPDSSIARMKRREKEIRGGGTISDFFSAGLANPKSKVWSDLPYVLFRTDTTETVSRAQMREMGISQTSVTDDEDIRKLKKLGLLQKAGDMVTLWDEDVGGLWGFTEMTRANGVTVDVLMLSLPYSKGVLMIGFYKDSQDATDAKAWLTKVARTVSFSR